MGLHSLSSKLGKYRLIAELGHGGMADVYLAAAQGLGDFNKLLVIKILRNTDDPDYVKMFLDEARLAARLNHPNVVHTYEVGQEGDNYYLVMEFLHGPTLSSLRKLAVQKNYKLGVNLSLFLISDILNGLQYAHELKDYTGQPLNIVHRDLTPQNILITFDGECKILDFGIAKASGASCETKAGVFKGKIAYASPDQTRYKKVDHRSDLFSVAVMLWESIVGHQMWKGVPGTSIWLQLYQGQIPSLRDAKPDTPSELIQICERGLAVDPNERFSSAREFQDEIDRFLDKQGRTVSRKEVAKVITTLFESERAKIQSIIESQLAKNDSIELHRLPKIGETSSRTAGTSEGSWLQSSKNNEIDLSNKNEEPSEAVSISEIKNIKSRPKSFYYIIAIAVALVIAAIYWYLLAFAPGSPDPSSASNSPAPQPSVTSSRVTLPSFVPAKTIEPKTTTTVKTSEEEKN